MRDSNSRGRRNEDDGPASPRRHADEPEPVDTGERTGGRGTTYELGPPGPELVRSRGPVLGTEASVSRPVYCAFPFLRY